MIVSALCSCLWAPVAFSQVSSSAANHQAFEALLQDQYPNQGGYNRPSYNSHHNDSLTDHLALELGAGFNVPSGNTTTWQAVGYSINLGGGWMFNNRIGVLAEYTFNRANIPTNTLTNIGEPDGNVHVWSLGLEPIIYYKTGGHLGGYVIGGGGPVSGFAADKTGLSSHRGKLHRPFRLVIFLIAFFLITPLDCIVSPGLFHA